MIRLSALYPRTAESRFDMDYYVNRHVPMVRQKCGAALKGVWVDQGLAGFPPGTPPPYAAVGHLVFDSIDGFQGSFGAHLDAIVADIANFTNVQPVVQISEVKL